MEQTDGVLIADPPNRILLYPPHKIHSGGYGFEHNVELVGGPFQGTMVASSYVGLPALLAFHRELLTLYRTLIGEAHLPGLYENLALSFVGDGLGHIRVNVDARAGPLMEVRFSFELHIDQTQLLAIIAGIDRHFLSIPAHESR